MKDATNFKLKCETDMIVLPSVMLQWCNGTTLPRATYKKQGLGVEGSKKAMHWKGLMVESFGLT